MLSWYGLEDHTPIFDQSFQSDEVVPIQMCVGDIVHYSALSWAIVTKMRTLPWNDDVIFEVAYQNEFVNCNSPSETISELLSTHSFNESWNQYFARENFTGEKTLYL